MTPKTAFIALSLLVSFLIHAEVQASSGKLFIIDEAQRSILSESSNPDIFWLQTERLELTTTQGSLVDVQRCGSLGCADPVGGPVSLEAVSAVNESMNAVDLREGNGGSGSGCRVCRPAKAIPAGLQEYVNQLRETSRIFKP